VYEIYFHKYKILLTTIDTRFYYNILKKKIKCDYLVHLFVSANDDNMII